MKEKLYSNHFESVLDEVTVHDLEIDKIFKEIDFTYSAIGSQILFYNLLNPQKTIDEINDMESRISQIKEKSGTETQDALGKFNKELHYKTPSLFFDNERFDFGFLRIVPITVSLLLLSIASLFLVKSNLVIVFVLFLALFNSTAYFILKFKLLFHVERMLIYRDFKNLVCSLREINIPNLNLSQSPDKMYLLRFLTYLIDQRTSSKSLFISEAETLVNSIIEVFLSVFCLDFFIIKAFEEEIQTNSNLLHHDFLEIGKVDFLLSVIELRKKKNVCIPEYRANSVAFDGMYHPVILDFKPLSFSNFGHSNIILGSNMSGKTVLIKTIAINCLLFRCLNTAFSKSYISDLYMPFSLFEPGNKHSDGESYFKKEILRFDKALERCNSGRKYLFLIDEPLKGTHHQFSTAINCAILSEMAKHRNVKLFITSHSFETGEILRKQRSFQLFHMGEQIHCNDVIYNYTIHAGPPNIYNPIQTILNGILTKEIANAAEDYYSYLNSNNREN